MKKCPVCLADKTEDSFYPITRKRRDGSSYIAFRNVCILCDRQRNRGKHKKRQRDSSKPTAWERNGYASEKAYLDYQRDYYRRNREKISRKRKSDIWSGRLHGAKRRAKELGMEFNITREYLDSIYVSHCPILGIELSYINDRIYPNSASIDRIDNSIGYVVGNIQILSYKANRIKGDASIEELVRFADYIHSKYKNPSTTTE